MKLLPQTSSLTSDARVGPAPRASEIRTTGSSNDKGLTALTTTASGYRSLLSIAETVQKVSELERFFSREGLSLTQVLQFPAECRLCGNVMRAGTSAQSVTGGKGFIHKGECPDPKKIKPMQAARKLRQDYDPEQDYETRRCGRCGRFWSFLRGSKIPPTCPDDSGREVCNGTWSTDEDDGWAIPATKPREVPPAPGARRAPAVVENQAVQEAIRRVRESFGKPR